MKYVLELQRLMVKNDYLISIRDNFETLLTKSVLKVSDQAINEEDIEKYLKNRVFSVIVECVQNICANDNINRTDKDSVLLMNKIDNGYQIAAGSRVDEQRKQRLGGLLETLDKKTIAALKKDKLKLLSNRSELTPELQDELTFLELFIRSDKSINFYFDEDDKGYFFMVKIDLTI